MDNITIESTTKTPSISFRTDGRMLMEGRSMPENVTKFYSPLIQWARLLCAQVVKMDVNLEYINSESAKEILELLKVIDTNGKIKDFIVNWHYEHEDEDVLEKGQIFEEMLSKADFTFFKYS